ncbi:hypothetical protein K1T71_006343 [Dendrolimus kikuchii]|uniref:Uncharacterized protein n=1 Tax=Dendrolimus kikuchii TaxID=765133 RepID=A0ACC1D418_9NEOP|nr:hypothetical protein K1T71_006343 [Dendrolimus kikuchii]
MDIFLVCFENPKEMTSAKYEQKRCNLAYLRLPINVATETVASCLSLEDKVFKIYLE